MIDDIRIIINNDPLIVGISWLV